jgi:hypothetical protein
MCPLPRHTLLSIRQVRKKNYCKLFYLYAKFHQNIVEAMRKFRQQFRQKYFVNFYLLKCYIFKNLSKKP